LLGASTGWIPLVWKCGCFCGWTISWTCCCGAPNSNYFLRPLVITLNIFCYFQTSVNSNFFWSTCCFIDYKTNMQMLKKFQIYFVRNQKLIKTQNSPRKLLKLVQIQIKIFKQKKQLLKLEIVNLIVYNSILLCGFQMLEVFSIPSYYNFFLISFYF